MTWTLTCILAAVGIIVTIFGIIFVFFTPYIRDWISAWWRKRYGLAINVNPYIFTSSDNVILHGLAVDIKARVKDPFEIPQVVLRISGIDFSSVFLHGFSEANFTFDPSMYKTNPEFLKDVGVNFEFRLEYNQCLLAATNANGLTLPNKRLGSICKYFLPVHHTHWGILKYALYEHANVSIIVKTLEGDRIASQGKQLKDLIQHVYDKWGHMPFDPNYPLLLTLNTIVKELPNMSNIIGTCNDKPIGLTHE